jgi:methyl-accepting chemotaxis protein
MSLATKNEDSHNESFDLDPIMKQLVDLAPVNIMLADKYGKLVYMNESSSKTLKRLEKYLPEKVENIVGKSIDMFHKNPSHQLKIISNAKNLPIQSTINDRRPKA